MPSYVDQQRTNSLTSLEFNYLHEQDIKHQRKYKDIQNIIGIYLF